MTMPKFFIQLGFASGNDSSFYSHVYGPFDNDIAVKAEMARRWPNEKEARFIVFEGEICGVPTNHLEKPETEKRAPGDKSNWKKSDDGSWHCNTCGALIMGAQVAHPIHDGPFPLSGSGSCEYETIGYCPNCERKPGFHGAPVSG
jgi:hypothetical protein